MVVTTNSQNSSSNLQTIDLLLNNSGPPNVALQVNILFFYLLHYTNYECLFLAFLKCT